MTLKMHQAASLKMQQIQTAIGPDARHELYLLQRLKTVCVAPSGVLRPGKFFSEHRIIRVQQLGLGELRPGEWRELNPDDVKALQTPEVQLKAAAPSRRRSYRPKQSAPPAKSRGKSQRTSNRKPDHSRRTQRSNKRTK